MVWAKLRDEVTGTCSGRIPTYAELKAMTYLNDIIKEGEHCATIPFYFHSIA